MSSTGRLALLLAASLAASSNSGCAMSKSNDPQACVSALGQISPCSIGLLTPSCEGRRRDIAERFLEQQCSAFDNTSAAGQRLCRIASWFGLCHPAGALTDAVAIASLDDVCPTNSTDSLCDLLRRTEKSHQPADYEAVRSAVAVKVKHEPRNQVVRNPAVRWFLRERTIALFAWNVVTKIGSNPVEPPDYSEQVRRILASYYPAYGGAAFTMSRTWLPPRQASTTCRRREGLLFFPGVVRIVARNEFEEQREVLHAAFPCLETIVVNSGTFDPPADNADQGRAAVAELDRRIDGSPLHVLGYSQGSLNGLWLLANDSSVRARVQTMLTFNSAAHGSEVADHLLPLIQTITASSGVCTTDNPVLDPVCEAANNLTTAPPDFVLGATACAMGLPERELSHFLAAEQSVEPVNSLHEFLVQHRGGVRSLTTSQAALFWRDQAPALPTDTLFVSYRSIVRQPKNNLPASNCLTYQLLNRVDPVDPYNDMQVRLVNQSLGGAVADREVVEPVAEGNHWQWKLAPTDLPEFIMPREMTEHLPARELFLAHYQALHDVGLLLPDDSD